MTILIDPPNASGHGRMWSHLVSDASFEELHAFARGMGIPERGFDRDHYDVPAEWHDRMVEAGALPVTSRELIQRLVGAGLRRRKSDTLHPRRPGQPLMLPEPLVAGDVVAVVVPAGPVDPVRLGAGMDVLRGWGLQVRPPEPADHDGVAWLSGTDRARADALEAAWTDDVVKAVWCARGGFGSQRILDLLDWRRLAAAGPAWLVGYSDVTALHQAYAAHLGVATVHGPGVASLSDAAPETLDATRALLLDRRAEPLRGRAGGGGSADGILVGGNLTMLSSTVGTAGSRPAAGGVALLEDVGERPYRIDRALTELIRSGWFDEVRAIACGSFTDCGDPEAVDDTLRRRLAPLGVPLVLDLPVGHGAVNLPLVLGRPYSVDGDGGRLSPVD